MDVEHFRPKGAYLLPDGKKSKLGYYWLAADWTNLLPSCIDCNRERKQVRRLSDGTIIKSKSGKANKFPLADENTRAQDPGDEINEVPLLLDPCIDNPTTYLEFLDDGSVRPKNTKQERELRKGRHSIEVFGLDRDGLLRERRALMDRLKSQMHHVCSWALMLRKDPNSDLVKDEVKRTIKELRDFATKDSPYLAMVRAMIRAFNRALKDAKDYLKIRDQLLDDQDNLDLQAQLEEKLNALKRKADDKKPAANIAKHVVEWMRLLEQPN